MLTDQIRKGSDKDALACPDEQGDDLDLVAADKQQPKLGEKAKSAVLWNTGFNLFRDVLQFLQMLVLARLLDEAAYGQFAFVVSVIGFLAVFSAAPFMAHTVQVKSEDEVHYQDHFTAAAVLQFTMFILANLVGLLIAELPSYAAAAPLVHVLSLTFLLEWACELRLKMLERSFDFRRLRLLHGIGLLFATFTGIFMAATGWGAYSLVVPGMLVTLPFTWDLFVRHGWRPDWSFSWRNYQPAFRFGLTRIGSGLSLKGRALIESSVLTAVLGFGPLGILNRAIGLANLACAKIASQLMYAIYPILTRLSTENGQAARAGDLVLRTVLWTAVPIAVALGWLATPVVNTIYGTAWGNVIPLLKWTLTLSVATAAAQVLYMLVLARNHARLCLSCDVTVLLGSVISLSLALGFGLAWYLIAQAAVQLFVSTGLAIALVADGALTRDGLIKAMSAPVSGSLFGVAFSSAVLWLTNLQVLSLVPAVLWGLCFGLSYVLCLRFAFASTLAETVRYLPGHSKLSRVLFLST